MDLGFTSSSDFPVVGRTLPRLRSEPACPPPSTWSLFYGGKSVWCEAEISQPLEICRHKTNFKRGTRGRPPHTHRGADQFRS